MSDTQLLSAQLFQQGRTFRIDGNYDQAITMLQRAIAEDATHAEAHMELGLCFCFTGLFDESIEELQLASRLDQHNPEIYLNLAKTYTMLGMFDEGKVAFQMVLILADDGSKCHEEATKQLAYFT